MADGSDAGSMGSQMRSRLKSLVKAALRICAHVLPHWAKWRRIRYGYELRDWYRRVVRMG